MLGKLIVLFIAMPLLELYLLVQLGRWMGLGWTLFLVIVTGMIGASLARQQGFRILTKIKAEMDAGRVPAGEMIDGVMILIGGIVLLTPGLITDIAGFALLIPPVRRFFKLHLQKRFTMVTRPPAPRRPGPGNDSGPVIDV